MRASPSASEEISRILRGELSTLEVGDAVTALFRERSLVGTVRYLGPVAFAEGEWVGVQVGAGQGVCDGTVGNTTYFVSRPGRAIFVPVRDATPLRPRADEAAPSGVPSPSAALGDQPSAAQHPSRRDQDGAAAHSPRTTAAAAGAPRAAARQAQGNSYQQTLVHRAAQRL
ncbi:hypothetical protein FNF27_05159 [Cafeteria roenbergensis]|uniref:CAP-Gly domain-containing protein n=1 Tax=Cafeteria roenbergensis TaxID=33653 RepID=A0A5A8E6P6_CAFRO|nr:hypothetical protein FNF27_05159 [Cafeteria roenbergensis]